MKKIFIAASILVTTLFASAQHKKESTAPKADSNIPDTIPAYIKDKNIPHFSLLLDVKGLDTLKTDTKKNKKALKAIASKDSIWFSSDDIPAKRPAIIIYFSPECGHCQHEMREIMKNIDSLKKAMIVMGSYFLLDSIKSFAVKYATAPHNNLVLGRDEKFFFPVYYKIKFYPYIAVYDANHQFVKAYEQGANMAELISIVNASPAEIVPDKKSKKKQDSN